MDNKELFLSCRRGDLSKLKYLVEQKEVNLNIRDKWDSLPMYYACLCGHEEVVQYLLENGAACEANTFDGERCLYGALTNRIKKLLLSYNMVSSKVLRRDLYEEFLRKLKETDLYQDITFHVHGERIPAHKCVLSARSPYFAELFRTKWLARKDIFLKHKMIIRPAFKGLLQYLYTGQMDLHTDYIPDAIRLARQCKLDMLIHLIEEKCQKLASFESMKPGVNVTTLVVEETDRRQLQLQFGHLADLALPQELCSIAVGELPFEPEFASIYADIVFLVEGHKFYCHKSFFCGRSDYFKVLINDHFGESWQSDEDLPVYVINGVRVDIFTRVMYYIYQDTCELSEENVFDVMCAADLYLLPGLNRRCANVIAKYLHVSNVVLVIKMARMFNLCRLEDQCAEFMANNLEQVIELDKFRELVLADADNVANREETDTIDIIDSIRFHVTNFIQRYSDVREAEEQLKLIDTLLEELGLEG